MSMRGGGVCVCQNGQKLDDLSNQCEIKLPNRAFKLRLNIDEG